MPKESIKWWAEAQKAGKIGFLDIETSDLDADGFTSMMLTWFVKTIGKNEFLSDKIDFKDMRNAKVEDKKIVQSMVDVLTSHKYDIICTYYGTNFDNKFLRSRALYHQIDFPVYGELLHLDLYYAVKKNLKLGSNRLESVCDYWGIKGKTKLVWSTWRKAMQCDQQSLDYIYEHNKQDVVILEKVFHRLKPYIKFTKRSL
jgi:uncharacterized protein YprB with RNaseH-like and TPR domain